MLAFSSKASTHWTSFGWCRQFMMLISSLMFSFSLAEYALKNFPAQTFPFFFSTSLKTCPNFPLKICNYFHKIYFCNIWATTNSNNLQNIPAQPFHSEIKMSQYQVVFYIDLQKVLNEYHVQRYSAISVNKSYIEGFKNWDSCQALIQVFLHTVFYRSYTFEGDGTS